MSNVTRTLSPPSLAAPRPAKSIRGRAVPALLLAALLAWLDRLEQRRQLANLTARELADIGLEAGAARRDQRPPFWL